MFLDGASPGIGFLPEPVEEPSNYKVPVRGRIGHFGTALDGSGCELRQFALARDVLLQHVPEMVGVLGVGKLAGTGQMEVVEP